MSDYEPVGVKFTTQNLSGFLADFQKATEAVLSMKDATEKSNEALDVMSAEIAALGKDVKKTGVSFEGFADGAGQIAKETGGVAAALAALGPQGAIAGAALAAVSGVFSLVSKVVSGVVNGIKSFISSLVNLAGRVINTAITGIRNFVNWLMEGQRAAKGASDGIGIFDIALGNVVANGISSFINGIQGVIAQVESLGTQVLQASGRVEQMTQVAIMMGTRSGQTSLQIQQLVRDIRDKGIEAEVATNLVIELSRANIDLSRATELARVAQDAAVISNSNSSETLERLKYAIMTTQTEVARTAGITINAEQAYQKYAETLNKSASQLSSVERQQAFLNAILEEGAKIAGAYEVSLNSGYKVLQSMPRVYDDLMQIIGGPFQQAYFNVMRTQYDLARSFNMLISEGTAFNDILMGIGGAVAAVTEPLRLLATNIYNNVNYIHLLRAEMQGIITTSQLSKLNEYKEYMQLLTMETYAFNGAVDAQNMRLEELKEKFGEMTPEVGNALNQVMGWLDSFKEKAFTFAKDAFDWGFNIVMQFAEGIINAASSVLTGAMDAISNMLSFWLAPGSPPRVAPDLDTWGLEAMNSWLDGFSDADYSVLNSIGNSLRSAFDLMLGDETGEASSALADIQKQLMKAFDIENMGGVADYNSIFANIRRYAGGLSDNMITLIQQEIKYGRILEDVEKKTKAVEDAEKSLKESRLAEAESLERMNSVMDEYNALASAGASKQVLDAKRKEFATAKGAYKTAKSTTVEKEKELNSSQETLSTAQEALEVEARKLDILQKQNSQTMEILELQKRAAEAAIRAAEALSRAGGGLSGIGAQPALGAGNIEELINTRLEEMKRKISDIFAGKFPQLVDLWNNTVIPAFNRVKEAWGDLSQKIQEAWDRVEPILSIMGGHLKEILTHVGELFTALSSGDTQGIETAFKNISAHISVLWENYIQPFLEDTWSKLQKWWNSVLLPRVEKIGENLLNIFNDFMKGGLSKDKKDGPLSGLAETLDKIRNAIIIARNVWNTLVLVFQTVSRAVEKVKAVWKDLNTVQENGKTKLDEIIPILKIIGEVLLGVAVIFTVAGAGLAAFTVVVTSMIAVALTPLIAIVSAVGLVFGSIATIIGTVYTAFGLLVGAIVVGAGQIAYEIGTTIRNAIEDIKAKFDEWKTKAGEIIEDIKLWFSDLGQDITAFVDENIQPLIDRFQDWADKVSGDVMTALSNFSTWLTDTFTSALNGIKDAIQWVIDKFNLLKDALANLVLPYWLESHSPSPLEESLLGIQLALEGLGGLFESAFGGLSDLFNFDLSDFDFVGVISGLADGLADAMSGADIAGAFSTMFTNIMSEVTTFGTNLNSSFANNFASLVTKVNLLKTNVTTVMTSMMTSVKNTITNDFNAATVSVETSLGTMTTIVGDGLEEMSTSTQKSLKNFADVTETESKRVMGALTGVLGSAMSLKNWADNNVITIRIVTTKSSGVGSFVSNSGDGVLKEAATGADFIVPSNYPNDSFTLGLTSGERVIVLTKEQQQKVDSSHADAKIAGMRYAQQMVNNSYNNENNFNLNVSSRETSENIIQTFGIMKLRAQSVN